MMPLALLVATLEDRLIATGHADEDISVIARVIRELATGSADDSNTSNQPPAPV
jgi:hypothetical protein